jgi:hypothetical protein
MKGHPHHPARDLVGDVGNPANDPGGGMTQNLLSKSNLWCQELFQGTHLYKIMELFLVTVKDEIEVNWQRCCLKNNYLKNNLTDTEIMDIANTW